MEISILPASELEAWPNGIDSLGALSTACGQPDRLLARIVGAQEAERARIAADIHDDPLQAMAAAVLRLGLLEREVVDQAHKDAIHKASGAVQDAIKRLRALMFDLHPPGLEDRPLADALRGYLGDFGREAGLEWHLDGQEAVGMPTEVKMILFRIAQEALHNVRKHADARRVELVLADVDGGVLLEIRDDGAGCRPEDAWKSRRGHVGLTSMRDRAEQAGGRFELRSAPGAGVSVEAWIPNSGAMRSAPGADPPLSIVAS